VESEEARMKVLLALLLVATKVAWAFAQGTLVGVKTYVGVSGAPLTACRFRRGRSVD
jgi:hypothetical protein